MAVAGTRPVSFTVGVMTGVVHQLGGFIPEKFLKRDVKIDIDFGRLLL